MSESNKHLQFISKVMNEYFDDHFLDQEIGFKNMTTKELLTPDPHAKHFTHLDQYRAHKLEMQKWQDAMKWIEEKAQ